MHIGALFQMEAGGGLFTPEGSRADVCAEQLLILPWYRGGGVERLRREVSADGDDNQTPRSLIFRQIKRQGKAGSGTAGLL